MAKRRPLPLTKARAAQLAGVVESAIRAAMRRGDIPSVPIAESTDGSVVMGVPADFLERWQPNEEFVGRRGRAPGARQ